MDATLNVGSILMSLCGGLALFLFGMDQMTDALKILAGERMKSLLGRLTTNRFKAVFAGAFVTSIIQSSSVTTVLVVGFISAGLMSLSQSIGVILGADIGTTITAQIVAFKITHYALIPVAVGFTMLFAFRSESVRHYGHMIMGLGLIFYGMQLMSNGTYPLRSYPPFRELMGTMDSPLTGILIAALFTALVQSSSASIGVAIVLASQGLVSLEAGIALVFGANIGTCITAVLAAIGKPREAVRAALVHVLFKVVGVLLWLGFISQLAWLVREVSPASEGLEGTTRLAADTPRQIANAHTIFNVANTALFIGFVGPLTRLMEWLVPERRESGPDEPQRLPYLDDILLRTPSLAFDVVRMELSRLGAAALHMVRESITPVIEGTRDDLEALQHMDNEVDTLHRAIITYLGRLSQENLTDEQSSRLRDHIATANYLENIGDMIETNLVEAGLQRVETGVRVSDGTQAVLRKLHERVTWSVERAVEAIAAADVEIAGEIARAKDDINRLASEADGHLAQRLATADPHRLEAFRVETDLIENLKRIYYFAKRIAKIVVEHDARTDTKHRSASVDLAPSSSRSRAESVLRG